jgi:hypothetical protein
VQKPFGQKMYELQGLKTGFVDQIFECKWVWHQILEYDDLIILFYCLW